MSKFDFSPFRESLDDFAVSKEKYTKEQAIQLYLQEFMIRKKDGPLILAVTEAWVRHHIDWEDDEKYIGWWLEYEQHKGSCPVWAFHTMKPREFELPESIIKHYEYLQVNDTQENNIENFKKEYICKWE